MANNEQRQDWPEEKSTPAPPEGEAGHLKPVWVAMGAFRSMIQSGETWTEECDRIYREAHKALVALEGVPGDGEVYDRQRLVQEESEGEEGEVEPVCWKIMNQNGYNGYTSSRRLAEAEAKDGGRITRLPETQEDDDGTE